MTDAMNRIMTTPLAVDARGSSVRVVVAADKYTVANVSEGMNDREEYARLFAAAPEFLAAALAVLDYATLDDHLARGKAGDDMAFGIRIGDLRRLHMALIKATGGAS